MAGITVGVMALIVVLSVMNGFQKEIRSKTLSIIPHVEVTGNGGRLENWAQTANALQLVPHVQAVSPVVSSQALFMVSGSMKLLALRGIEPTLENKVVNVEKYMVAGQFPALQPGAFGVVIGDEAAKALGVSVGDKVAVYSSEGTLTPMGMMPRSKQFTVVGLFHVGLYDIDSSFAMINLRDAQRFGRLGDAVTAVQAKLDDPMRAPEVKNTILTTMPDRYAQDWTDTRADYFSAVELEKHMMTLLLGLIVLVAGLNLVSTLVMIVTDKQSDIAILRTLGAAPRSIMLIFVIQGAVAGLFGTLLGVVSGVLLALNAQAVVNFIGHLSGHSLIAKTVYFVDYLPTDVHARDVLTIAAASFLMAIIATLYPSWRAGCTHPVEALRYE
jgi:lipoprotein-releasing system permease protein